MQTRTWRGDNLAKTIVAANVLDLGYTWDANKRKTEEMNNLFAGHTNHYNAYDDEDRLTGWQLDGAGDTQTWSLSKVGDWTKTTIGTAGILPATETRTHNAVHEIETVTPPDPAAQLAHDAKGNLTHPYGKAYVLDAPGNPKADPNNSQYGNPSPVRCEAVLM